MGDGISENTIEKLSRLRAEIERLRIQNVNLKTALSEILNHASQALTAAK